MKRGDVMSVADGRGDFSGKPRPGLVVQTDLFNETHGSVTVCPITRHLIGDGMVRVRLAPLEKTGLILDSEVEIDKVQSVRRDRIRDQMGVVGPVDMARVDAALRLWLDL